MSVFDPPPKAPRGERISKGMKEKWKDPEFRAHQRLARLGMRISKPVDVADCSNCERKQCRVVAVAMPHLRPHPHVDPILACAECFSLFATQGERFIRSCKHVLDDDPQV